MLQCLIYFVHACIYRVFFSGAGTALLGERAAMACTVAVEEVITEHYNSQLRVLHERADTKDEEALRQVCCQRSQMSDFPFSIAVSRGCLCTCVFLNCTPNHLPLPFKQNQLQMIAKHRDEELEHREIGLKNDAENVCNISMFISRLCPIIAAVSNLIRYWHIIAPLLQAPFYSALTSAIKAGCHAAIWLSKRV